METKKKKNRAGYAQDYYKKNKENILQKCKTYYDKKREEISSKRAQKYAAMTVEEKRRSQDKQKGTELLRLYNLTLIQHDELLARQGNKCACCGRVFTEDRAGRPCVDHDHKCCSGYKSCGQCVRALLCRQCNLKIGIIEKNPFLLKYLKERKEC